MRARKEPNVMERGSVPCFSVFFQLNHESAPLALLQSLDEHRLRLAAIPQGLPNFAEKLASSQHLGGCSVGTGHLRRCPGFKLSRPGGRTYRHPGGWCTPGASDAGRPSQSTWRIGEARDDPLAAALVVLIDSQLLWIRLSFPPRPCARPHTTSPSRTERHASAMRPPA